MDPDMDYPSYDVALLFATTGWGSTLLPFKVVDSSLAQVARQHNFRRSPRSILLVGISRPKLLPALILIGLTGSPLGISACPLQTGFEGCITQGCLDSLKVYFQCGASRHPVLKVLVIPRVRIRIPIDSKKP